MKEVPKKDEAGVSGGLTGTTVVQSTWPTPLPFPTEPCSPVINDPLGDLKKSVQG